MQTNTNSTESKTDSTTKSNVAGYEVNSSDETSTDNNGVDDFGYGTEEKVSDKETKMPPPPTGEAKEDDKQTKEEKPSDTKTGYEEPPKEDGEDDKKKDPKDEKQDPPSDDEEKVKKEISEIVKELPETMDKDKVAKFATDNKLTPAQLKAYAELVKNEKTEAEASQKKFILEQRKQWHDELKTDKEFGGEKFDYNVKQVGKVLENYMPNMKKVLTERGSVLPPYIMKDLLSLSKILDPKNPLVSGDPSGPKESERDFIDDMYQ